MNHWVARGLILLLAVAAVAGLWRSFDLSSRLNDARERAEELEATMESTDERTRDELTVKEKRVATLLDRVESWRRSFRDAQRLADDNFCFHDVVGGGAGFVRGPLRADVDGDGSVDSVYALGQRLPLAGKCRYSLAVKTETTTYRALIRARELAPDRFSLPYFLTPRSATQLDARPGLELLVEVHQGASSVFGALYALRDGQLVRLGVSDHEVESFVYEGSMCCGGALNCVDGSIVHSEYRRASNDPGYIVTRRFLEVGESSLVVAHEETRRVEDLARFREFGSYPLTKCPDYVEMTI